MIDLAAGKYRIAVMQGAKLATEIGDHPMLGIGISLTRGAAALFGRGYFDFMTGVMPPGVDFSRAGSATYFDAAGVLQTAAADQPRFDHDPVTLQPRGLLIEGSRTNLLLQSNDVGNASWAKQNATVTVGSTPSPLGLAADVVETATSATHGITQAANVTTGTVYTFSFYAKAKGRSLLRAGASNLNAYAVFDLSAGTVQYTDAGVTAKSEAIGGGWYRCSVTQTAASTEGYNWVLRTQSATSEWPGSGVYTGDGVSGVSMIGAQLEAGAFPSSYIPTTTAAATRAADTAVMTGADFSRWFNPVEGTFLVEASSFGAGVTNGLLFAQKQNSAPRYQMSIGSSGIVGAAVVNDASVVVAPGFGPLGGVPFGTVTRAALAYKTDDFACTRDGLAPAVDTSGDVPLSVNYLRIGEANNDRLNGHFRRLRYWPTRLPNARLQEITA